MDNKNLHCRPVVPMPEWLRLMAPKGRVGKLDFAKLLGYKGAQSLDAAIANGEAPRPRCCHTLGTGSRHLHPSRQALLVEQEGRRCRVPTSFELFCRKSLTSSFGYSKVQSHQPQHNYMEF